MQELSFDGSNIPAIVVQYVSMPIVFGRIQSVVYQKGSK